MKPSKKNKFPAVVKTPTPANRRMNPACKVSMNPSSANRSLNPAVKVSPSGKK